MAYYGGAETYFRPCGFSIAGARASSASAVKAATHTSELVGN